LIVRALSSHLSQVSHMHTNKGKGATTVEFNYFIHFGLAICIGDFIYGREGKGTAPER
jgi:hypothetical protein